MKNSLIMERDLTVPANKLFWQGASIAPPEDEGDEESKLIPVCDWIENRVFDLHTVNMTTWDFSRARLLELMPYQRVILEHLLTPDRQGRMPYRTIIWSQPKKSGKTQIAGAVGAWWADQFANDLVLTVANDQEQSAGRIFSAMGPALYQLTGKFPKPGAPPVLRLSNGTMVRAIPNNYEGESGADYGMTLWSELWCFKSERGRRLFEELIPVPTRPNSLRWIETYAGYEDESKLLLDLFLKIFRDTGEQELQPETIDLNLRDPASGKRLPCWARPDIGLFVFWDHELRMPWQQNVQYYNEVAADLRESARIRLIENRWQKTEGGFIPAEWWDRSVEPRSSVEGPMFFAVDGALRHDLVTIVGVRRIESADGIRYRTGYVKVWDPEMVDAKMLQDGGIDLDLTVGRELIRLNDEGMIIGPVWYDEYQLHQTAINLRNQGVKCERFSQGEDRTQADTFLFKQYKQGTIENDGATGDLTQLADAVKGAKAIATGRDERLRLIKGGETGNVRIDPAVAQSMAVWKASIYKPKKKARFV